MMETKLLYRKCGQVLVAICILVICSVLEAGAVTLPFSDDFSGYWGQPGSDWSWTDKDDYWWTDGGLERNSLSIRSRGYDIWDHGWDRFDYYAAYYLDNVSGDFTASVQIIYQGNSDDWSKCGIMVKNDMTAQGSSSGYAICALTPSHGYAFQWDSDANGYLDSWMEMSSPAASPSTWVRLVKSGTTLEAYYSTDGSSWLSIGSITVSSVTTIQDVGLFVCSHNDSESSTVKFDNFSIIGTTATVYTYYADTDGDGYGDNLNTTTSTSTTSPSGYSADNTDCNDNAAAAHPGGTEVCDGLDNDCNGSVDEGVGTNTYYYDGDGDGYGISTYTQFGCTTPTGFVDIPGDCNDTDSDINPGIFDICGDDIDQDCSGTDRVCGTAEICMDISDVPLTSLVQTAPPMIMFVLDDSGSMAWDVLCPENNGQFDGAAWINDRKNRWKSQFYDYNGLYYNPSSTYEPWPNYSDVDPNDPPKHPVTDDASNFDSSTRDMDSTYTTIDNVAINYAHWYMWSAEESAPYLVMLKNNSVKYYKVDNYTSGDHGRVRGLASDSSTPADVVISRTYAEERQNFANWFTYYRTRELTAKAALGKVINEVNNVKVGIYAINEGMKQAIQPINVDGETDYRDTILNQLYHVRKTGWTPLRQGLQAVGEYYQSGIFAGADDGGACQQAFTIVMTDGYYNGDAPSVGNADNDSSSIYDGGIYADSYSNTLADVAMHYYERDLSTLDDSVSGKDPDTASHQHMVTYTVSFGLSGTLSTNATCPETESTCPTWVNPQDGDDEKIDDLWHTAVNGRGDFLSAADTEELIYALTEMIMNIQDRSRTGAAVSMNSQRLEKETDMFQGYYDTSDWTGNVKAFSLDDEGNIATTASWDAQAEFENVNWGDRRIFTFDGTSAVAFDYDALTTVQKNLLSTDETTARNLVDYIHGDSSNEMKNGGVFRNRTTVLGDIVDSSPNYDNGVVYVGANDGMMHAFRAVPGDNGNNGVELFGFIPSRVIENLRLLADTTYSHKFFVNGPITTAVIDDSRYLIGGLGKGGRGYYGITITNAESITESTLPDVWEYPLPDATDGDMGFTYSVASVLNTNIGRPLIIFGNGYDSPNGRAVLYILKMDGTLLKKIDTEVGDSTSLCNGLSTPVPVDLNYDGTVDYLYAGDLLGNMWKFDLSSETLDDWGVYYKDGNTKMPLFQAKNEDGVTQPITGAPDLVYHCDTTQKGVLVIFGTGRYLAHDDLSDSQVQSIYGIWDWGAAWEALDETGTDKFFGAFQAPTNGERPLSNLEASDYFADDKKPRLLKQEKYWDAEGNRHTTDYDITWFNPEVYTTLKEESSLSKFTGGLHVGWYVDLPDERERVVSQTQIREGMAIIVSIIPSNSPCEAGGRSYLQFLNICDGSEMATLDGDDELEDKDKDVILPPPAIFEDKAIPPDPEEPYYLPAETQGVHYWRIFR